MYQDIEDKGCDSSSDNDNGSSIGSYASSLDSYIGSGNIISSSDGSSDSDNGSSIDSGGISSDSDSSSDTGATAAPSPPKPAETTKGSGKTLAKEEPHLLSSHVGQEM
jgi:hypothetical protein